ncbi:MAG: hypothetical protein E6R07_12535 [Nevskiaceae bacterium]|nr:MAG: hypothetical protein E6R07_12535 [Nevskiaceae bacterium]
MHIRHAILAASLGLFATGAFAQSAPGPVPAAVPVTQPAPPVHQAQRANHHRAHKAKTARHHHARKPHHPHHARRP